MSAFVLDEGLETFRDACLQAANFGETGALRAAAFACHADVTVSTCRAVLDAARQSRYLQRIERDHINVWVPA